MKIVEVLLVQRNNNGATYSIVAEGIPIKLITVTDFNCRAHRMCEMDLVENLTSDYISEYTDKFEIKIIKGE